MRVCFGLFFFASGFNKVFIAENQALMLETIIEAGIPFPHVMAWVVAICEMISGALLVIGLFTRLGALALMIISFVALLTIGLHQIPSGVDPISWYSWMMYLPEPGYIIMSLSLFIQGCGPWGMDRLISKSPYLRWRGFNPRLKGVK